MKNFFYNLKSKLSENLVINNLIKNKLYNKRIVCYHKVISDEEFKKNNRPDNNLVISQSGFKKHLQFFYENYDIVEIKDLFNKNSENKISITFDDGYLDNYYLALPELKLKKTPSTIFITTGFLNNNIYPWWEKIWDILKINKKLTIKKKKKIYLISINNGNRKKIYYFLNKYLLSLSFSEQKIFFNNLYKLNSDLDQTKDNELFLNEKQLKDLTNHDFISLGAHTHYHNNLSILNPAEIEEDVLKSKKILENLTNKEIIYFAFPYGFDGSFNNEVLSIVRKNFKYAVTTKSGNINFSEFHQLPRIGLNDFYQGKILRDKLSGFDDILKKLMFCDK